MDVILIRPMHLIYTLVTKSTNDVEIKVWSTMKILVKEVLSLCSCDESEELEDSSNVLESVLNLKVIVVGLVFWSGIIWKWEGRMLSRECVRFKWLGCFMIIWFEASYLIELYSYNLQFVFILITSCSHRDFKLLVIKNMF